MEKEYLGEAETSIYFRGEIIQEGISFFSSDHPMAHSNSAAASRHTSKTIGVMMPIVSFKMSEDSDEVKIIFQDGSETTAQVFSYEMKL